ncbi:unnamed protein product, partial [Prorocentrum cordatum]
VAAIPISLPVETTERRGGGDGKEGTGGTGRGGWGRAKEGGSRSARAVRLGRAGKCRAPGRGCDAGSGWPEPRAVFRGPWSSTRGEGPKDGSCKPRAGEERQGRRRRPASEASRGEARLFSLQPARALQAASGAPGRGRGGALGSRGERPLEVRRAALLVSFSGRAPPWP